MSLYGLPIIGRRHIHYGPVDPELSRELFIRHALVQFEYHTTGKFFTFNRRLISELEKLEAKSRRRDLFAEEQVAFDFYDALLPDNIISGKLFEQWRKQAEQKNPKTLYLNRKDLLHSDAKIINSDAFPDHYIDENMKLKFSYHFDPTHKADGVTLIVPLPALGQLDASRFEWLVPGMLAEKLTLLIKSLPKAIRRNFVPAPQFAQAAMESMLFAQGELLEAFACQLQRMTGIKPHREDWATESLPAHLCMKFRITGESGKTVDSGNDLKALQLKHAASSRESAHCRR